MRLLLDTNVVLWQLAGDRALSASAVEAIGSASEVRVSAVTFAEIGVKVSIGKLQAPADVDARLEAMGIRSLALSARHGLAVATLPVHHRDPFDRLLIAQAFIEELTIVTGDSRFEEYDVETVLA